MLSIIVLGIFFVMTFGLIAFFMRGDRGAKEPRGALFAAFGYGLLGVIIAAIAEAQIIPHGWDLAGAMPLQAIIGFLLVGVIEEACKFGPLAGHIYGRNYFNEVTDGIIYFGISGLAFGLFENILYLVGAGSNVGVLRIIILLFFHGASSGIVGYYLIRSKLAGTSRWGRPVQALVVLMVLHGLYDYFVSTGTALVFVGILITVSLNIALFVFWQRARELDVQYGLSADGPNKYCQACGKPNPKRDMYCPFCGAKT